MADITELDDADICAVIGVRLKIERLRLNLTQKEVSLRAGISLRTYKRFESSGISSLPTFVAVLRVLNRLRMLDYTLPNPATASRETLADRVEKIRKRAKAVR